MQEANKQRELEAHALDLVRMGVLEIDADGVVYRAFRKGRKGGFIPIPLRTLSSADRKTVAIARDRATIGHVSVARLVWMAHTDAPIPEGGRVLHRNGDQSDNRPENLELYFDRKRDRVRWLASAQAGAA